MSLFERVVMTEARRSKAQGKDKADEAKLTKALASLGLTVEWLDFDASGDVFHLRKDKKYVGLLEMGFRGWVTKFVDAKWKAKVTTALKAAGEKTE